MTTRKTAPIPPALWRNPLCMVALGFGAGALPRAPGTWGTLAAVPIYLLLSRLALSQYLLLLTVLFLAGVWICGITVRKLGVQDHAAIVWDEMVGFWVSMAAAPPGWMWLLTGFVLFRLFDIWKPWPIAWLDRRIAGGLGVMADDLVAGLYAALCLHLSGIAIIR